MKVERGKERGSEGREKGKGEGESDEGERFISQLFQ